MEASERIALARGDIMFAAEMLAAYDKMIDAAQIKAVLDRMGASVDIAWVRTALNTLADAQPPQLLRCSGSLKAADGSDELLFWLSFRKRPDTSAPNCFRGLAVSRPAGIMRSCCAAGQR
jgi:hypothetical protein